MKKHIRILLIDDHQIVREGLRHILKSEKDMEVVGETADAKEAFDLVELYSPEVILMDIRMPSMDGIELTRQLKAKYPYLNVIILTLYKEYLTQAMEAGARGYLTKDIKRQELAQAIRDVHHGEIVINDMAQSEYEAVCKKAGEDCDDMEEVQLVIPPIEANHLIGFVSQVEDRLSCSVRQTVSSWQEGTAIILFFKCATPLADILNKLAEMPEVEAIVEKPPPRKTLLSLLKKAAGISRISPKTILVTLNGARKAK